MKLHKITLLGALMILFSGYELHAQVLEYAEYRGVVIDADSNDRLESVSIKLEGTNLGTITNDEGKFILKVPDGRGIDTATFSLIGYETKKVALSSLEPEDNKIRLLPQVTELSEVSIPAYKDAEALVKAVFVKKAQNNLNDPARMTAFYRETIKRRNRNVSLTEAVVNLYKQPYISKVKDAVTLEKARKNTDYRRLDTVAMKLQGGPFSTLYLDVMKYPEYIFTPEMIGDYNFSFGEYTKVNDRPVIVVNFAPKPEIDVPRYVGSLFIDSETIALHSAIYSLNLGTMKEQASKIFVRKKPRDIEVTPLRANYKVDYREKNGVWYYGYGSVDLSFKVNKRRKIFNSVYTLSSEMAVTDWTTVADNKAMRPKNRLRPTVVLSDEVSGFSDPEFWGPYNVIEPEKSIESAINKIRRKLRRNGS